MIFVDNKTIFFITGASGVGKTTLVSQLKQKFSQKKDWVFLHFDSIGVPSPEKMTEKYGSPSKWQKAMTFKWIKKLLNEYKEKSTIFLEGQVNLEFIKQGFAQKNFSNYKIILIHCSQKKMIERLKDKRKQPELATKDMKNWLEFLYKQAVKYNIPIIDTSSINKDEMAKKFEKTFLKK
jgi:predicted AAA+ superfamily ATPase